MTAANGAYKGLLASDLRIKLKIGYCFEKTTPIAPNRFVYCWQKEGGSWKSIGILASGNDGTLYDTDRYIRSEFKRNRGNELSGKKAMVSDATRVAQTPEFSYKNRYAFANPVEQDLFNARGITSFCFIERYQKPYLFSPGKEYYFTFVPLELILNKIYQSPEKHKPSGVVDGWANVGGTLLAEPDPKWLSETVCNGTYVKVMLEYDQKVIPIKLTPIECLRNLYYHIDKIAVYREAIGQKTGKSIGASTALKQIVELIEITNKFKDKDSYADGEWRRGYSAHVLDEMAHRIDNKFNSTDITASEIGSIIEHTCKIIDLLRDPDFKKAFNLLANSENHKKSPFIDFLHETAVQNIISEAILLIADCPSHDIAKSFFQVDIMPFLASLARKVNGDGLSKIRDLFFNKGGGFSDISIQFLNGYRGIAAQKSISNEFDKSFVSDLSQQQIMSLFGSSFIFQAEEDKQSIFQSILKYFSDQLGNKTSPLSNLIQFWFPFAQDIVLDAIEDKSNHQKAIGISAFFMRSVFGLSNPSMIGFFKNELGSPTRWYKRGKGDSIPPAPTLVFSSISLFFSVAGMLEYFKKQNPTNEDKFNLFLSLTAGGLDLGYIFNPSFDKTKVGFVLKKISSTLKAVDGLKKSFNFMLQAQDCFIHKDPIEGTINVFRGAIELSTSTLSISNLLLKVLYGEEASVAGTAAGAVKVYGGKAGQRLLRSNAWTILKAGKVGFGVATSYLTLIATILDLFYVNIVETKQHKIAKNYSDKALKDFFKEMQNVPDAEPAIPEDLPELQWSEVPEDNSMTATHKSIEWNWHSVEKLITVDHASPNPMNFVYDKYHTIAWTYLKKDDPELMKELLFKGFPVDDIAGLLGKTQKDVESEYQKSSTKMVQDMKNTVGAMQLDKEAPTNTLKKYGLLTV